MQTLIAYCGLDCSGCPIFKATLEQDPAKRGLMRVEIARTVSEQYGWELTPEEVTDCDGCRSETGRLFSGCERCEIRRCAAGRNLTSCAYCGGYACRELRDHFQRDPGARTRIESLRKHH